MKKVLTFFLDFLKGIGIGISCIIPGVSGGTFALLTNCYDKLVGAVSTIFKNFLKSFLILLPIGLGILLGAVAGYFGISKAFDYILFTIIALFAGLILGSIPSLFGEVKHEKVQPMYVLALILAFLFVVGIGVISFIISIRYPDYSIASMFENPQWYLYVLMFPIGIIGSFALVTPGISGSMLLLVLGFYQPILDTIHDLIHFNNPVSNFFLLFIFGLGVLFGFFFMSKLMKYLLDKRRTITYYSIIGFVMGSLISIFLNLEIYNGSETYLGLIKNPVELAIGIPLFIVGALASFFLIMLAKKRAKKTEEVKIE